MKLETARTFGLAILRSLKITAVCLLSVAFLASCDKDDDDDEALLTLEGSPKFYLPIYAFPGDTLELYASGVSTEGSYYDWSVEGLDSLYATDDRTMLRIVTPDSLAIYSVTLTADCGDEYYSSSLTQFITVVDSTSVTGTAPSLKVFTDPRDNASYGYVTIGNLDWFNKNLNWKGAGEGFGKTEAAAYLFGRFYTWEDATGGVSGSGLGQGPQGVCPPGWSIPTNEDWEDLAKAINGGNEAAFMDNWQGIAPQLMANAQFQDAAVWTYSPAVTPSNETGWNALASGCAMNDYNNYLNMLYYAFWWSSTEKDSNNAHYKYIYSEFPDLSVNYCSKDGMAASVRCVRLKAE